MGEGESLTQVLEHLRGALAGAASGGLTLGALAETLAGRGFGMAALVLALPVALPLPPGLNTAFGALLVLLAAQRALGRRALWIPARLARVRIPGAMLMQTLDRALPYLARVEAVLRPRAAWAVGPRRVAAVQLLLALVACLPLPLTHTVPGAGIILMAVGEMAADGLLVFAGAALGLAWVAGLTGAAVLGVSLLS